MNEPASDFTLRIRFRIPSRDRIGIKAPVVEFERESGPPVRLMSDDKSKMIDEAEWLIVESSGWESKSDAEGSAGPLMDALRRTLARHMMGADFGERSPKGFFTRAGLEWLRQGSGQEFSNDTHGPMVFETAKRPKFVRMGPTSGSRVINDELWKGTFLLSLEQGLSLSDTEKTAFELFSVAHGSNSSDARFVLLFSALEVLIDPIPRPQAVLDHVDSLIALTQDAHMDDAEKKSLIGSLMWLRSHSIRSAGRQFIRQRLGERNYQEKSAETFFLACYELRNRLLHGSQPYPTWEEVRSVIGGLDQMVSHLLAGPAINVEEAVAKT